MSEDTQVRQLVVFTLASEQYALPIEHVQEIIHYSQPRPVASSDDRVRGVLNLRGRIVPVYDLAARLGLSSSVGQESKIVIVETGAEPTGVIVDEVDEVLTVGAQCFERAPAADATLVDSIAKVGERLIVMLAPNTIFPGLAAATA
jgi:purine-binding chemotaxis protein CheW